MELTSFQLKWIAIFSMAVDHTGALLFPEALWMRGIGRLAFPIFAFLLAEGYYHTHDVKRYLLRLWLFALISEIPYDLALSGTWWNPQRQNVFFTLFISLLLLLALERSSGWPERMLEVFLAMWFAEALGADYGFRGVLLVLFFYIGRSRPPAGLLLGALWNFLWPVPVQRFGALAMFPLALYSGKRGRSMKYFFYVFYPAHLLVLYAAGRLLR